MEIDLYDVKYENCADPFQKVMTSLTLERSCSSRLLSSRCGRVCRSVIPETAFDGECRPRRRRFFFFLAASKRARLSNGDDGAASPSEAHQVKVPTPEHAGGSATPEGFEPNAGDDPQTEDETIDTSSSSSRFVQGAGTPEGLKSLSRYIHRL
jgi:hypothetical protein